MTVSSATSRVSYNGNGSTTVFAYTFRVFDQDDLAVIIRSANGIETVKTITTHYTVSGVGNTGGGNVTMLTAPASGETITILREQDLIQELDIVPNDPFPASSVEDALDKLTFMVQQHEETLGRTIKASRTNTISGSEFTILAADRANKVFAFDSSGNLSIAQELGTYRGNWAASTVYYQRDIIKDTSNSNVYICLVAHTSSGSQPISSNADVAKWALIVDAAAAATSAAAAAASASAASSSESAASSSASSASSSASAASADAATASSAAASAAASFDSFDDRYLGAKSSDPSVDNDGNALLTGALYFNSIALDMRVYTGSAWSVAYLPATGYVTLAGTETLLNKTLNDPKLSLGGTNGTAGQALVSQGAGVAPVWGSVSSVVTKTYDNRADLRSIDGPASLICVVESLGVFAWESGSTQIDDDETCFATTSGRWLLYAAAWDLVSEYVETELDVLNDARVIVDIVFNSATSIGALSSLQITKSVIGAELTDAVIVTPVLPLRTGNDGSVTFSGAVTAADQITVNIGNASASSRSITAGTLKILIVKGNA